MRTVNAEVQTYKFQIKLEEHMKQTIRTSDNYYGCTLRAAKDFQFETQVHCNYEEETVRYAVCRYIRHCPKIRDRFIREAVKLGLSTGKIKHRRHQIHVNVRNMELPGREAILTIEVGQGELIVKKLIIEEATAD